MPSSNAARPLHHARQLATASTSRSELEAVARITRVLVREWDPDVVLPAIVQEARGLLGSSAVMLWLRGAPPTGLTLAYSQGLEPAEASSASSVELDAGVILDRATTAADVITVVENAGSSQADPLASYLRAHHLAAMMLVPLLAKGRLLGVAGLAGPDPSAFDGEDAHRVAHLLGDLFALAVESTGLQERLRETNSRLVAASVEAQQRAEELSDEKAEREAFISLIAHELKNPLMVLKLHIARLQRSRKSAKQQAPIFQSMAGSADRLQRLVDDLLDASRIAVGHFSVEPEPVDVVSTVREVAREQQAMTQQHRIHLVSERDELVCSLDRQRLAQALSNLISNAIKYSPDGGDISVLLDLKDDWLRIAVADQGTGLSAEDLAQLFQPYTRVLRVREARGTGLGLFITKGIAEAHGGTISAASPGVGRGSTFTLALRCSQEQERASQS